MQVSATVRVKAPEGARPDKEALNEAARLLEASGFEVTRIGRFGVSVKGEDEDFARVLGVIATGTKPLSIAVSPSDPHLSELIEGLEVLPDPQLY